MEYYRCYVLFILLLALSGNMAAVINVVATLGRSVLLNLNYELPASSLIQWNFNGPLVAQYFTPSFHCYHQLTGRCEVYRNGSLRIDNVSYADEGDYVLNTQVLGSPDSIKSTEYQLRVYASLTAPTLRYSAGTNNPLISGTNVTLQCDAGNQSVTTYTFSKDQKMICSDSQPPCRGQYLDFTPISESDSGSYTCTIQNPVSSNTSNSLTLTVYAPVSAVTVTSNTSGALWAGQDSASLYCTAQGSAITFFWTLNGNPVSSIPPYYITQSDSPPHSYLTISPVSKNDTGPITCTASNQANSVTSNATSLNINCK
ncbi:pregnancy-specific beta-1-glycoprotein 8-like [Dendropsophus ebraccatus]|uniref:pregnancy-specific beta-1-glycoprotein 8-like n=1 Tax=Dendropsophus ebraccatus TaxID=150705 RepID=UPI003831A56D